MELASEFRNFSALLIMCRCVYDISYRSCVWHIIQIMCMTYLYRWLSDYTWLGLYCSQIRDIIMRISFEATNILKSSAWNIGVIYTGFQWHCISSELYWLGGIKWWSQTMATAVKCWWMLSKIVAPKFEDGIISSLGQYGHVTILSIFGRIVCL